MQMLVIVLNGQNVCEMFRCWVLVLCGFISVEYEFDVVLRNDRFVVIMNSVMRNILYFVIDVVGKNSRQLVVQSSRLMRIVVLQLNFFMMVVVGIVRKKQLRQNVDCMNVDLKLDRKNDFLNCVISMLFRFVVVFYSVNRQYSSVNVKSGV